MPLKKRTVSVDDEPDAIAMKVNEENVIKKLKTMLYLQLIADKLDLLTAQ